MGSTPGSDPTADAASRRFERGEPAVLREVYRDRVWTARPAITVQDDPNLRMFYVPADVTAAIPVDPTGDPLRLPGEDWRLARREGLPYRTLSFAFPDTPYSVLMFWERESDEFRGWYVNIQEPLRATAVGFDTMDHTLDVTIPPDRSSWSWKDEQDLEAAVERGVFSPEDAAWFRYWGERGVEHVLLQEPPFDRDWIDWQPDPAWETPALPDGWDLLPV
jgi:predicted RNA-binding protein associated with RNAse of E/G family